MRKTLLLFVMILLAIPVTVLGHTSLSESNPADGETVREPLEEIELTFEGTLEEQSTFEVVAENGETVPLDVSLEGSTLSGSLNQPLSDGNYTVNWTVVGTDGHPIDGHFSFEAAGAEKSSGETSSAETSADSETETTPEQGTDDANASESEQSEEATATEQTQGMSPVLIGLFVLLGLIVILSAVWLVRRK